ncbi:MAG: DUF2179 domain-containing protein [Planctomycetota bacterium]
MSLTTLLLVVAIFCARVADVSLSTVRTILVFRGRKYLAAAIGFFEVMIWLMAASRVLQNLDAWYLAVAYAGGFAAGNIVGIFLEGKLAIGSELVRAVSHNPDVDLASELARQGYSFVEIPGRSGDDQVEILLLVEKRKRIPHLLEAIDRHDPSAYYTITDVKEHASSYVRTPPPRRWTLFRRKGK